MSSLLWCNSLGLRAVLLERANELGGQLLQMFHRVIDYPGLLPENGRGLLTVAATSPGNGTAAFSIESETDGLPVIRAQGGVITSALVREIEGFAA